MKPVIIGAILIAYIFIVDRLAAVIAQRLQDLQ
jgi:hypothetical protein